MKPGCSRYDPATLKNLLEGRLDGAEEAECSRHLDDCEICQRRLELVAAEDWCWAELRRFLVPGPSELVGGTGADVGGAGGASDPSLDFLEPSSNPGSLGRLGQYEVNGVLGRGGMGVVLRARDPALDRPVAIKVLAPSLAVRAAARQRFAREARAAAAVTHEHVVAIHAVAARDALPYLVMEFVPGRSLQERLDAEGPTGIEEAVRIARQVALGLSAAHGQGLVHRDVKPANILLANGVERVKLTDFGLARAVDDVRLTQSGVIAGTPQYMAPEQARGEPVDPRADLFALGGVIYAMIAGHPPFRGTTALEVLRKVCDDEPPSIRGTEPSVPEWLEAIIARLMAKDPAARFATASEVAELLARGLLHLRNSAEPPPSVAWKEASCPGRRVLGRSRRRLVGVTIALSVVAAAIFAGPDVRDSRNPPRDPRATTSDTPPGPTRADSERIERLWDGQGGEIDEAAISLDAIEESLTSFRWTGAWDAERERIEADLDRIERGIAIDVP